jgi:hypothetical protein
MTQANASAHTPDAGRGSGATERNASATGTPSHGGGFGSGSGTPAAPPESVWTTWLKRHAIADPSAKFSEQWLRLGMWR